MIVEFIASTPNNSKDSKDLVVAQVLMRNGKNFLAEDSEGKLYSNNPKAITEALQKDMHGSFEDMLHAAPLWCAVTMNGVIELA